MFSSILFRSLPNLFILFFIFFELTPNYFLGNEMIKPLMFFSVLYCWLINDIKRFPPISIFIFCSLYDLIQGGAVGITALFFLLLQYSQRRKFNDLISNDFKETWMKFIISLTLYLSITSVTRLFFDTEVVVVKNLIICFIFSIALFPLFFSITDKLSYKFKNYNE